MGPHTVGMQMQALCQLHGSRWPLEVSQHREQLRARRLCEHIVGGDEERSVQDL